MIRAICGRKHNPEKKLNIPSPPKRGDSSATWLGPGVEMSPRPDVIALSPVC